MLVLIGFVLLFVEERGFVESEGVGLTSSVHAGGMAAVSPETSTLTGARRRPGTTPTQASCRLRW